MEGAQMLKFAYAVTVMSMKGLFSGSSMATILPLHWGKYISFFLHNCEWSDKIMLCTICIIGVNHQLSWNFKDNYNYTLKEQLVCRGVVAESEDIIKDSANTLGKQGFINYFGLQVISSLFFILVPPFCFWRQKKKKKRISYILNCAVIVQFSNYS